MPQFTSCCPGWCEPRREALPRTDPAPVQLQVTATDDGHHGQRRTSRRTYGISLDDLYVVSIVPCLAKKYEAGPAGEFATDGIRDVDAVVTTSEFIEMMNMVRLDPKQIQPDRFDDPYSRVTGAGVIFGASGGVAEAALRMAVEKLTGEAHPEHLEFQAVRGACRASRTRPSLPVGRPSGWR